jgi:HEPN domain-containing protein
VAQRTSSGRQLSPRKTFPLMTPQQLRENARQFLSDAKALLATSPKNAAYLAGYAVEFVLKARYCRLRKWDRFPDTPAQLKEWNARDGFPMTDKLFVHDLQALLRLSEAVELKTGNFHRIDWDRASDWSEKIRYDPVESVTHADAEKKIEEIEKFVEDLIVFEIVQTLCSIEIELSRRFGLFHCFAFVVHPDTKRWILLVAWMAQTQGAWEKRASDLSQLLDERLAPDLRSEISDVHVLDPYDPLL